MNPFETLVLQMLGQGLGNLAALVALNSASAGNAVSAFSRPQPTVVMGPDPLPVTIVGGPGAAAYQQKPPPAKRPEPGAFEVVANTLAGHFRRLFGPLQQLSTYLTPAASGFGVFQGALQVFATAVAPVLLPVFVTLAVGLLELSDVVWSQLKPAFTDFAKFMMQYAVPAVSAFVRRVNASADYLKEISGPDKPAVKGEKERSFTDDLADLFNGPTVRHEQEQAAREMAAASKAMHKAAEEDSGLEARVRARENEARASMGLPPREDEPKPEDRGFFARTAGEVAGGGTPDPAKPPATGRGKAMDDVLKMLELAAGSKASFQGLGSVGRSAQLAALGADPFQQRILVMFREAITVMQENASNTKPKQGEAYPTTERK